MTVRHLRIFIAVYQAENITRAAEQLHMTQPTVTRAVQELERYYGVKLFERVNRRIYVTESGRQLYARAVHIVDSLDRLEREMKDRDRSAALRVGATATPGSTLLPDCMAAFAKSHPDTPLKLTVAEAPALRTALLDSRLDFAVSEEPIEDRRLRAEVLAQDHLVALLPPDDPRAAAPALSVRDLARAALLVSTDESMGGALLGRAFARRGITVEPMMRSSSVEAIVQAVHAGLGIAFLPESLTRRSVASGFVVSRKVDDEPFLRNSYLVWHRNKFLTQSAMELMALCRAAAKETEEKG